MKISLRLKTYLIAFFCYAITHTTAWAAHVDTIRVYSTAMKKNVPVVVVVPDAYKDKSQHFPVVYFLHGYSGNHKDWVKNIPEFQHWVDLYQVMAVCTDGGFDSWYFDSPVEPTYRYETFVSSELVQYIDKQYRTKAEAKQRGITGLSMGGHGALYLATRHADVFGAAASMSGGVDFTPFPNNWNIKSRLGTYTENKALWEQNTVLNQPFPASLQVMFDCGVDDFFIEVNRALHKKLLEAKVPHIYTEKPGKHDWVYWRNVVPAHFLYFSMFFKK